MRIFLCLLSLLVSLPVFGALSNPRVGGTEVVPVYRGVITVDTVADLIAVSPTNIVYLKAYSGTNGVGGGLFELRGTNGYATNATDIFTSQAPRKFWFRTESAGGISATTATNIVLALGGAGAEVIADRFGAHPTNIVNSTNIQIAFNYLDSIGGGTLRFTNRGTYIVTNAALSPANSLGHMYALIFSNRNPITVDFGAAKLLLASNAQISGSYTCDVVTVYNSTNLTILNGDISGNRTNQPNWSGGYAQVANGVVMYAKNVKGLRIENTKLHDHFANPLITSRAMDVTMNNVEAWNCGEGFLNEWTTNLFKENCSFLDPANVNTGDAHEFAESFNVLDIGSTFESTNFMTGGSALDVFGSKRVKVIGFYAKAPYFFDIHNANLGALIGGGATVEDVVISDSYFEVPIELRARTSGNLGAAGVSGQQIYTLDNVTLKNAKQSLLTDTNFQYGTLNLNNFISLDPEEYGIVIAGGGKFNFSGYNRITGSTAGDGILIYASVIPILASNGPIMNFVGTTEISSNSGWGINVNGLSTNLYHIDGQRLGVKMEGNGSGTIQLAGGALDYSLVIYPVDYNNLPKFTNNTATGEYDLGSNIGTQKVVVVRGANAGFNSGIGYTNGTIYLFAGQTQNIALVVHDGVNAYRSIIISNNGAMMSSEGNWIFYPNGKISQGSQGGTNKLLVYDGGSTNLAGFGLDDSGQAFRMFSHNTYPLLFGFIDGNSNFVKRFEVTSDGRLLDGNGSRVVTNATGIDGGGAGSGSVTTLKENGSQVGGADIVTLDFLGADFDLTESPDTEVNIVIAAAITRDAELVQATNDAYAYALSRTNGVVNTNVGSGLSWNGAQLSATGGSATVPFVLIPDDGSSGSTNFTIGSKSNIFRIQGNANIVRFAKDGTGCNGCEVFLYNTNTLGLGFSVSNAAGSTNSINWKTEAPPADTVSSAAGITTIRLLCTASNIIGWYEPPYGTANLAGNSLTLNGTGNGALKFTDTVNSKSSTVTYSNITQNLSNVWINPWPQPLEGCWKVSSTNLNASTGYYEIIWTNGPCQNASATNNAYAYARSLTNLAVASVMTQTNFVLNQIYTNDTGASIVVNAATFFAAAAVNGNCAVELMASPAGGTGWTKLSSFSLSTLVTGLTMTGTNSIVGVITNTGSFYFTNSSSGAGNSAGLVAGSGQFTKLGGGTVFTNAAIAAGWGFYMTTNGATITMSPTNRSVAIATNATSATLDFSDAANVQEYHVWYHLTTNLVLSPTNPVVGRTLSVFFHTNLLSYDLAMTNTAAAPVSHNFNNPTNGSTAYRKTNTLYMQVFITAKTNGTYTVEQGYYRP